MDSKKKPQVVKWRDECQSFACAIQGCLQQNDYNQDKCEHVIQKMLDCCEQNANENYPSCDGFKFQVAKRQKLRAAKGQSSPPAPKS